MNANALTAVLTAFAIIAIVAMIGLTSWNSRDLQRTVRDGTGTAFTRAASAAGRATVPGRA